MKLMISSLLFPALISSANANHANSDSMNRKLAVNPPITDFGGGCMSFHDDGSWAKVPDFETNGPFVVDLESPFTYSSETNIQNERVRVEAHGEVASDDRTWSLGIFKTFSRFFGNHGPDIFRQNSVDGKHDAWYKSQGGKFGVTWASESSSGNEHNTFQLVLSEAIGGDMGEGNNVCFCYGEMQWGPGQVRVRSSGVTDHAEVDYFGGNFQSGSSDYNGSDDWNRGVGYLDHKTCCFNADKLKGNPDFASLCQSNGSSEAGSSGDPHFKTWQKEHFEYHGQCDLVLAKDADFANGLGIDVHIRTKLVRHWSYIKNAVIRIGNDILEIEGSSTDFDSDTHYWINYEYQGELTEFGGFPVEMFSQEGTAVTKNRIEIDLSPVYHGQKIVLSTFKEFVKVSFENASEEAFGSTVGMLGDFRSGKTLARDGITVLGDFVELGHEWQVLPSDKHLFHEVSSPQFPDKCIDPEDPRGERRRRRLDGALIDESAAEAACSFLEDPLDRKDCVYDVLATQDLGMVGAY